MLQLAAACLGMGDQSQEYRPPITFVVVQKRHHTRLFPGRPDQGDRSGNIMPGTFNSVPCHCIMRNMCTSLYSCCFIPSMCTSLLFDFSVLGMCASVPCHCSMPAMCASVPCHCSMPAMCASVPCHCSMPAMCTTLRTYCSMFDMSYCVSKSPVHRPMLLPW